MMDFLAPKMLAHFKAHPTCEVARLRQNSATHIRE